MPNDLQQPKRWSMHPKRWTGLTWLGVVLWGFGAFALNYLPGESYVAGPNGDWILSETYESVSEIPFPVGWPLHYLKPTPAPNVPVMVGAPMPLPGPSVFSWIALGINVCVIGFMLCCLIFCSQRLLPRFSIRALLILILLWVLQLKAFGLVAQIVGNDAIGLIAYVFDFWPIVLAFAILVCDRVDWNPLMDQLQYQFLQARSIEDSSGEELCEEQFAVASKLEQRGEWERAVEVYRMAADKWPDHAAYAMSCIARIEEKQAS